MKRISIILFIVGILFFSYLIFTASEEVNTQNDLSSKIEKVQSEIQSEVQSEIPNEEDFTDNGKIGNDYAYPDPKLTQGKAATTSTKEICGKVNGKTYSERHRTTTEVMKKKVYEEYGVVYPPKKGTIQVDHLIPLGAGGADSMENLWAQGDVYPSWREKDRLEKVIIAKLCNREIGIGEAQAIFTDDWVLGFIQYVDQSVVGGSESDEDEP